MQFLHTLQNIRRCVYVSVKFKLSAILLITKRENTEENVHTYLGFSHLNFLNNNKYILVSNEIISFLFPFS